MEQEEKKLQEQRPQYFYFNEDGKLVVESNKGVWVDGEQYVKMYGNFTCNAKTIGMIIAKLKGARVAVGTERIKISTIPVFEPTRCSKEIHFAIVNPTEEEKAIEKETEEYNKAAKEWLKQICERYDEDNQHLADMIEKVKEYNALPWYKRMFKQVELQ